VITPDLILTAYREGYFPMAESRTGPIGWFSPDPRAVIPLETFHVPRSLRRIVRGGVFECRIDTAFREVMEGCGDRDETWISAEILEAYGALHRRGAAHSVESWQNGTLVGGLYGISLGGAFFGESMFSRVPDASKVALVHLVRRLTERRFLLLDTQYVNPHLLQFGVVEMPRAEYLDLLARALTADTHFE
jgi:leucyl/phenylalanyl-tRNA--protein transferase